MSRKDRIDKKKKKELKKINLVSEKEVKKARKYGKEIREASKRANEIFKDKYKGKVEKGEIDNYKAREKSRKEAWEEVIG